MSIYTPKLINGVVTTAATRVKLASSSTTFRLATIQANAGNGGTIYIGDVTVSSSVYGIALPKGASIAIGASGNDPNFDLTQFYADTSNSGDGFSILYF